MKLSIVIVNYNVKFFLEQCLVSVFEASVGIDSEVWVVDNNSVDGSVAMVREKFPQVKLIANNDNPGFSKANNQALRQATGEFILLLNPDTLVEKDTFQKCIDFMETHPDCGGLGVKMINGEGRYLPESKRGFPSPEVSFYKISGLIHLFPKSKRIAHYYLGHLSEDETNEIEILPGAYLMIRKTVMDKIGLLDETFFMYGEDIDFSYRILQAGYKNYYLPSARIIHYKGESTKKGSMNYVYTFYNAMVIFAQKHLTQSNAKIFTFFIKIAIWLRASLAFIKRALNNIIIPLLDFALIYIGFFIIKNLWATLKADNINYYPSEYTYIVIPIYILIWLLCIFLYGGYRKPVKLGRIFKGLFAGTCALLVFYSLLDETQRYSRALILLGTTWAIVSVVGLRGILHLLNIKNYNFFPDKKKSYLIVGDKEETTRVANLFNSIGIDAHFVGFVNKDNHFGDKHFIGNINQLIELIRFYKINEVIFCSKNLSTEEIISLMANLQDTNVEYKIAPQESQFIIGTNTIHSTEDLYTVSINTIATSENKRNKRIFDTASASLIMLLSPILFWFQQDKKHFYSTCTAVLLGKRSWVGYCHNDKENTLPTIKKGIFSPMDMSQHSSHVDEHHLNLLYARNYKVMTDFIILLRNIAHIHNS
ncbi:MAG: glycosyltransferase [Bacteroidales bacterium]|nr:glycosyltransferase [Bacteroidales bacterium]